MVNKLINALNIKFKTYEPNETLTMDLSKVPALSKKRREVKEQQAKEGEQVIKILTDNIADKQKISILVTYYNYTEEDATKLVIDGQGENQGNQEDQV